MPVAMKVEHDRVQPSEEVPARIKKAYLLYRLIERAENQLFSVLVVGTKQDSSRIKAIAVFGNQPFCSSFAVFSYLLPDFHRCFRDTLYSNMRVIWQMVHFRSENLILLAGGPGRRWSQTATREHFTTTTLLETLMRLSGVL